MVMPLLFFAAVETDDPENDDDVEKAVTCETARMRVMALTKKDFIFGCIVCFLFSSEANCE